MRNTSLLLCIIFLSACKTQDVKPSFTVTNSENLLTPSEVVAQSTADEWRLLDPEYTLYLNLESGTVVIELMPQLAPLHVENTKILVRQGIFDNTNFYRVIDGFVAQGGPLYESEVDMKTLEQGGTYTLSSELTAEVELADDYTRFDTKDGYADETGFLNSFPIGRDLNTGESWLLHCYGALGMGRANDLDSGGTELYIVNGAAQRYLDRNVTVFGRVIEGMSHIQALKRGSDINGAIDLKGENIIKSIQVAADMPANETLPIEVMDSKSDSFAKLLKARKNRTGEWFVFQHDYMDTCGVPIPTRLREN